MRQETQRGIDYLTPQEDALLNSDFAALVDDTDISLAVVYRRFGSTTFVPSTGEHLPHETSYSVRAVRTELKHQELFAAQGLYQQGDIAFLFSRRDISFTPTREDYLLIGTEKWEIVNFNGDPVNVFWRIVARKVA